VAVSHVIEDLRNYVWDNWNEFTRSPDSLCVIYEFPYQEINGAEALIPLQISFSESSEDSAAEYNPDVHEIHLELGVEDLAKFAQYFNPYKEHPRWRDLKGYLTENVVHEITHAMEFREELVKQANRYDPRKVTGCWQESDSPECREALTRYFNAPIEVSAMTNEIVYQIVQNSEGTLPSRIETALDLSPKWGDIKSYLTEKNKKLIFKRVYTRLYTGDVTL